MCILECVLGISGLYLVFGGMKLVYEGMLWHWFLYFICGHVFLYLYVNLLLGLVCFVYGIVFFVFGILDCVFSF